MKQFSVLVVIGFLVLSTSAFAQQYRVIDISPAGSSLVLEGIGGGQQVGMGVYPGQPGSGNRAVMWSGSASTMVDLTPPFYTYGNAKAAANGVQVGTLATTFQQLPQEQTVADYKATMWRGSASSFVSLHPAGFAQSWANCTTGIEHGGYAKVSTASTDPTHAMLWLGNAMGAIDLAPYGQTSVVNGCAPGVQVGTVGNRAAIWFGSAASYVDLHPRFGFTSSVANGVTAEQTVGWGDGWRALLWTDTDNLNVINLHPAGATSSYAWATSGSQQVGFADYSTTTGSTRLAMLWSGSPQSAVYLHQFLPAGYIYSEAFSIDEFGNIAGRAIDGAGGWHAVVWAPVTPVISASVRVIPNVVVGGQPVDVTVRLSAPAGAEGATVQLSTTTGSLLTLPATVFIPAGQSTATITAATSPASSPTRALITASYGSIQRMASLSVEPATMLQSLSVSATTVAPGTSLTGTITLRRPAPVGGASIAVYSSDVNVTVPALVQIPEGALTTGFPITVSTAISSSTYVSFTAFASGVQVYAGVYVTVPDQVQIVKAQYVVSKGELQVEATSSSPNAVLTAFVDGRSLGPVTMTSPGRYKAIFILNTAPRTLLLQSDQGGSASTTVPLK
jgi:hypothetical protein